MLKNFSEKLLAQLQGEISQIKATQTDPFKILSAVLRCVRTALKKLKDYLKQHPFKDKTEQVCFFKHLKPLFECYRIYELELYNILTSIPVSDAETIRNFYKEELKVIQRFFRQVRFHYEYYRLGATELDELYFVRGVERQSVLIPEVQELDPEFSTSCDYLFSKIKAYEMLQDYLLKALNELDSSVCNLPRDKKELPELRWTGDKVNLVEVIYALYFTGQLNNGNADVSVIVRFLERHLQIDLSRAYRDFTDIRNRKVCSPTKYIDQMRESIHKRIDDDLAFKSLTKMRSKSMS